MAPSVQELPTEVPSVSFDKLALATKEAPKVKRQIEVEGGKTDAKVGISYFIYNTQCINSLSIHNTSRPGIMAKSTQPLSHTTILSVAFPPTPHSQIFSPPTPNTSN
jgi:hypothetical protein